MIHYQSGAVRALVHLHERHMRSFLETWKRAKAAELALPATEDPDCMTLEAMLAHTLRASRGYMVWMCANLALPDPEINPAPDLDTVEIEADDYLEYLLERWRSPLVEMTEARIVEEYTSNWGETFTVESMLEHAVMHPIRHAFQLETLLARA